MLPSGKPGPWASGKTRGVGAAVPRPARLHVYASRVLFPRPAQGLLPAQAGSPLAGRDWHPLDDKRSFMKSSHPPIPFDQQGLVALDFLSFPGGGHFLVLPALPVLVPTPIAGRLLAYASCLAASRRIQPWHGCGSVCGVGVPG